MAPEEPLKSAKASQDELAVISNRLAIAMAKREALVKSWTASSSSTQPEKTQEELDAEDAAMFRNEPAHLGVGAAIPAHFLANESERGNKALRAKMFATKGLKASKARDAEEKAASAKRRMREESSEEEEGRSSLGRAKKLKGRQNAVPVAIPTREQDPESESDEETKHQVKSKNCKVEEQRNGQDSKSSSGNKQVEKVNKALLAIGNKLQDPVADLNETTGDGESVHPVVKETQLAKVEVPKPVAGISGIEGIDMANLKKDDGMDAAERRKLKKKQKKKLKKLRDVEFADKA
ncbi:hypothetical protein VTL71DRAFT_2497 [Oculimacula yallundae]|uniref:Uncharacterized protein n=1 Tax=Oculimacula yallundae TaxID=86028 RepID=A0ABR4CAD9_9HELO